METGQFGAADGSGIFLKKADWKALAQVAHSLRGSATQLGAKRASHFAAKVETLSRAKHPDLVELTVAIEELRKVLALTLLHFGL